MFYYVQIMNFVNCLSMGFKGDSNPNDKYVLSERAPYTMNFDTSIIKIG